jgi:S-adenosylmethionine-diacylglycerol 3-amino-3-carboxypropyl transferase
MGSIVLPVKEWVGRRVFATVHRNNLVYNTCWEDPRLDRIALQLGPDDNVLVITSAGCNALDYVLAGPKHVYAVDMNPRQNALLELKKAAIRELPFETFFRMFGEGYLPGARRFYDASLRRHLNTQAREFWDRRIRWFENPGRSFYYRGTSGSFARMMRLWCDRVIKVRPQIEQLLNARTLAEQREIYFKSMYPRFWTGPVRFAMNRDLTMFLLGVPRAQRRQIEEQYEGGLVRYIQDCVEGVFTRLPMKDNYFWRVYMDGSYTRECCPEYLREENFERLRDGLVDRVSTHTDSVQGFLEKFNGQISRFVLLDHMDWLSDHFFPHLEGEWQAIVDRAAPSTRVLWRSGGLQTTFIDRVRVCHRGQLVHVRDLLTCQRELAAELHQLDRVHTYASFYIADLAV